MARAEYQNQEGRKDEDQGSQTRPLDIVVLGGDGGYGCTETEAPNASGQDAVAAAAATVPFEEENRVSVRANRSAADNSYPEMQMAWSQAHPLQPLSLIFSTAQPQFASFEEAEKVEQIPVVLPVHSSRACRRGRRYHSRKMLPEKFKPRSRSSQIESIWGAELGTGIVISVT